MIHAMDIGSSCHATRHSTKVIIGLGKVRRLHAIVLLSSEAVYNYNFSLKLIETVSSWYIYIGIWYICILSFNALRPCRFPAVTRRPTAISSPSSRVYIGILGTYTYIYYWRYCSSKSLNYR